MFSTDHNAVLKWCLNRPELSKNTTALKELASISTSQHVYRQLRPSYILNVEKLVTKTTPVLEEEYLNPFSETIDESLLYNLSSGTPLPNALSDDVLKVYSEGTKQMNAFKKRFVQTDVDRSTNGEPTLQGEEKREHEDIGEEEQEEGITDVQGDEEDDGGSTNTTETATQEKRKVTKSKKFHDPISRNSMKSFKNTSATKVIKRGNKTSTVSANRDIIGSLLSFSTKHEKLINWESALTYPLSPVPLSICSADGIRRKVIKSKLMESILTKHKVDLEYPKALAIQKAESTLIVDLMAALRSFSLIPETHEELFRNLLSAFPKTYHRVDIVADTYKSASIKSGEREKRGCSNKIIAKSAKSKIPRNFKNFLKNGENKTRLIDLLCQFVKENSQRTCNLLKCSSIVFSEENFTYRVSQNPEVTLDPELSLNQEEADTKVNMYKVFQYFLLLYVSKIC